MKCTVQVQLEVEGFKISFEKKKELNVKNEKEVLIFEPPKSITTMEEIIKSNEKESSKKKSEKIQKEKSINVKNIQKDPLNSENLSDIEKDLLSIAESILKLQKYESSFNSRDIDTDVELSKFPILEKLYAKAISKLSYNKGYSKEDLFLALKGLEKKKWIVSNERRSKREILSNEKYQKIIQFIKKNPGIHAMDEKISQELKITRTPFLKYAMVLQRFKIIRAKKIGKKIHYYLTEIPEKIDQYNALFLKPIVVNIIEEILKDQLTSKNKIAKKLGLAPSTVQYYLKQLSDLDLLKTQTYGNKKVKFINLDILKKYNSYVKEPNFYQLLSGL